MKKLSIAAALAATALATPALAQETNGPQFYIGPVLGYDSVKVKAGGASESKGDLLYGVNAGVDLPIGSTLFVGVEGEFTDSDVKDRANDVFAADDALSYSAGRNLYIGGRVGANLGAAKIYAKGGYSNAKFKASYTPALNAPTLRDSDTTGGYVLGGGAETKLTNNILLRAEYRYADYGEAKLFGLNTGADLSRHQVVAGALFTF